MLLLPSSRCSSVVFGSFQWEYLTSTRAICIFFFVSIRISFFSPYIHLSYSVWQAILFSILLFCFGFRTGSSSTAVPARKLQTCDICSSLCISQVFHFQFSLTVSLASFSFWGHYSPHPLPFSSLSALMERVFFLLVLVTLSLT